MGQRAGMSPEMSADRRQACRTAIARFREACEREPLVVASWLGGSFAAGHATEASDVDVYAVSREGDYGLLWNSRYAFVEAMGTPTRQDDHPNFEGLGFDLVHFELVNGVSGEIAFGHTGNFLSLHGGPHEVLLDRVGLLDDVSFPLL
jgi:predicted nucleotidyltransferase